nr:transposase [Noviherbaspirillum saxi]
MQLTTIGIDLAKSVFQVHGVDVHGKVALRKQLKRSQMATFVTNLLRCLIGMEACGSAHYWAHKLQALGHIVKLMASQFLKPYVKTNKHDAADAEAICNLVRRIPGLEVFQLRITQRHSLGLRLPPFTVRVSRR